MQKLAEAEKKQKQSMGVYLNRSRCERDRIKSVWQRRITVANSIPLLSHIVGCPLMRKRLTFMIGFINVIKLIPI